MKRNNFYDSNLPGTLKSSARLVNRTAKTNETTIQRIENKVWSSHAEIYDILENIPTDHLFHKTIQEYLSDPRYHEFLDKLFSTPENGDPFKPATPEEKKILMNIRRTLIAQGKLHVLDDRDNPTTRNAIAILRGSNVVPEANFSPIEFNAASNTVSLQLISKVLHEKNLRPEEVIAVIIPRAGLAFMEALHAMGIKHVAYMLAKRNEKTLKADVSELILPEGVDVTQLTALIMDPACATAGSALEGYNAVRKSGIRKKCFSLHHFLAEEAVAKWPAATQVIDQLYDIPGEDNTEVYTAAVDPKLNNAGYIVPGLGDGGDKWSAQFFMENNKFMIEENSSTFEELKTLLEQQARHYVQSLYIRNLLSATTAKAVYDDICHKGIEYIEKKINERKKVKELVV